MTERKSSLIKSISPKNPPVYEAVFWDGSQEAWDAICSLPWDDCMIYNNRPGELLRYRVSYEVPEGVWVYVSDFGPLEWLKESEAVEVDVGTWEV